MGLVSTGQECGRQVSGVHSLFVTLLAGGIGFSVHLRFSAWQFYGWPGLSGGDLGCLLGSMCLVLCGRLCLCRLVGTMDDKTSSRHIFLFMFLLHHSVEYWSG